MQIFRLFAALLLISVGALGAKKKEQECLADPGSCSAEGEELRSNDVLVYPIQHSLSIDDDFRARGELLVQVSKKSKKISMKFSSNTYEFKQEEVEEFRTLVNTDGFYRIRIPSNPLDHSAPWLVSSIRACTLLHSGFKESFRFHLDKTGFISSFELVQLGTPGICEDSAVPEKILLRSKAMAAIPKEAHVAPRSTGGPSLKTAQKANLPPEIAQEIVRKETSKEGEREETGEPGQSFFRKYWYIFLPFLIMSMFGGAEPPSQQQGGQPRPAPAAARRK